MGQSKGQVPSHGEGFEGMSAIKLNSEWGFEGGGSLGSGFIFLRKKIDVPPPILQTFPPVPPYYHHPRPHPPLEATGCPQLAGRSRHCFLLVGYFPGFRVLGHLGLTAGLFLEHELQERPSHMEKFTEMKPLS